MKVRMRTIKKRKSRLLFYDSSLENWWSKRLFYVSFIQPSLSQRFSGKLRSLFEMKLSSWWFVTWV